MTTIQADLEEDIFARPPRSARKPIQQLCHITCRVCGLGAKVPADHPALLCPNCMEDLGRTQAGMEERLTAALVRLDKAGEGWRAKVEASPARDRWQRVQDAMIGVAEKRVSQAVFDRQWALRLSEGGPLAALMLAYETHCRECDAIVEELDRLGRAQDEINAAWLNMEV